MVLANLVFVALQNAGYMSLASYPAGSAIADPEAPGGHGASDSFPAPITRKELRGKGLTALLLPSKAGVVLHIGNDRSDSWLRASDGSLQGWLEAKDATGKWRPIEYHHWAWCGNSRHRVNLPKGQEFRYFVRIAQGSLRTTIRWKLAQEGQELVSTEVTYDMAPQRFSLSPEVARQYELEAEWQPPTLKPKGNPTGG
ncbi:MAG TPA: hypothetical protein PLL78_01795 [Fimbriimonadaceae bacterium]|nr:hypothetical protein [Fimbriimonadaceae bacterium]